MGFCTSAAAKVTLFHASLENSEPTMAAPSTGMTAIDQSPVPQKSAKLAAAMSGWRKSVSPSRTSAASAPTLATLKTVWIAAPSVTPRMLVAVSTAIMTIATTRWGERPSWIGLGRAGEPELPEPQEHIGRDAGHQDAQELGERHRDRGDGAGLDDREEGPAVEEARERREPFAEEDVLAARPWASSRQARRTPARR